MQNQIVIIYLFSDIFKQFKTFFLVDDISETHFIYDIAQGFMPRRFDADETDKLIYDEEEPVPEMYFVLEGAIGIGFSLIVKGYSQKQFSIGKKLFAPQLICDHYVVNN
jgi:hypothetical protein